MPNPNLRPPWQPGQSGNPAGRPRKRPITTAYDSLVQSEAPAEILRAMHLPKGKTWADCIALACAREAVQKGGVLSRKEIRESIEGKSPIRIEMLGDRDNRVEMIVSYAEPLVQRQAREQLARMRSALPASTDIIDVVTNDDEEESK